MDRLLREFWLSTPRATGGITTDQNGKIVDGCPYFKKAYGGEQLNDVISRLRSKGQDIRWHEYK